MAYFLYASFPNSRGRPRSATIEANTYQVAVSFIGQPLTQIVGVDLNRTYTLIENLDGAKSALYLYAGLIAFDPTAVATIGVPMQLLYNQGTNTLYQKQDDGTTTNWVIVNPEDVGETIFPRQVAKLDALGRIWALADDAVAGLTVGVDVGRG